MPGNADGSLTIRDVTNRRGTRVESGDGFSKLDEV